MYVNGQKHFYEISPNKMLVQFDEKVDVNNIKSAIMKESSIQTVEVAELNKGLTFVNIPNVSKIKTEDLVKQWNNKDKVRYASPVLLDENGIEVAGMTNQILVRLKQINDYQTQLGRGSTSFVL
jgi:hypothetical protein